MRILHHRYCFLNSQDASNRATRIDGGVDITKLDLPCMPEINVALTPPTPPSSPDLSRAKGFASSKLVPWVPPHDWNVLQPKRRSRLIETLTELERQVGAVAQEPIQPQMPCPILVRPQTPAQSPAQSPTQAETQIAVRSSIEAETQITMQAPTQVEAVTETQLVIRSRKPSHTQTISQSPKQNQTQNPTQPQPKTQPETPVLNGIAIAHNSLLELTRFQRFIRLLENAGPNVILDRLKEEWVEPSDDETNEELHLEKRLWVL